MRMETGVVAKRNACVMITHGDSTVMCSAVRANPRQVLISSLRATTASEHPPQATPVVSQRGARTRSPTEDVDRRFALSSPMASSTKFSFSAGS